MKKQLIPHTSEWFEALLAIDRDKALHTGQIIELTGSPECCGVCGDTPALDYRVDGPSTAEHSEFTMRLCDDCADIRRGLGERLIQL